MSKLWKKLHMRALQNKGKSEHKFLMKFENDIPKYTKGCSCNEFWNKWIKENPPIYGHHGEFFAWTVKAHNTVNVKLGKPEMSVSDALKLYSAYNKSKNHNKDKSYKDKSYRDKSHRDKDKRRKNLKFSNKQDLSPYKDYISMIR